MKAVNVTNGHEIADKLVLADTLLSRLKGLLGKSALLPGEGLWIKPCKGVHTVGMKFPIDVVFLDRNNKVVGAVTNLPPSRVSPHYLGAASVLELPVNIIDEMQVSVGDRIEIR